MRFNNPGNLRRWGSYKTQDGFAVFPTLLTGIQAMGEQLKLYGKRGINTIEKIVTTWAPPSDNNPTHQYIANVANTSGYSQHQVLDLTDPVQLGRLIYAMVKQEQGGLPFDPALINHVFNIAPSIPLHGAFPPPPVVKAPEKPVEEPEEFVTTTATDVPESIQQDEKPEAHDA
jgi:hypothetical protein